MSSDLFLEQQEKSKLLDIALSLLSTRGREAAQAEQNYRIAKSKVMIEKRTDGVPTTILGDLTKGDPEIALLKFKLDCAEVSYKANLEALNVYKLQIKMLDEQISREWHRK